jgi:hypothetical protein
MRLTSMEHGARAALTDRADLLRGRTSPTIALDPHKWLFQPFEIGCVLVRDMRHLRQAFSVHPEDNASYLADVGRMAEREVVFYEHGVQLTRSFRALKLWMSLRIFAGGIPRHDRSRHRLAEDVERIARRLALGRRDAGATRRCHVAPRRAELAEANARAERAVNAYRRWRAMVTSTRWGRMGLDSLIHPDAR